MAAGLGFKDFATGEVLTANDVDGYLMQGVWVFASAAARDAAVTAPQEGNFAYLKDTNVTTYYTGSAWANLDTTGMTNPMTTTGDTIYSSSGSTPARLGIGSTGQVLTVAAGIPSWATPAAGGSGKVLQVVFGSTTTQVTSTSATFADTGITATITPTSASSKVLAIFNVNGIFKNTNDTYADVRFLRGASVLFTSGRNCVTDDTTAATSTTSISILDEPATTSATTYKAQFNSAAGNTQTRVQFLDVTTSTIILMEIGA